MRPGRRKTEFTNCILELRVNYETAITSISSARATTASRCPRPRVAMPMLSSPLKLSSKPTSTSLLHSSRRAQAKLPSSPCPGTPPPSSMVASPSSRCGALLFTPSQLQLTPGTGSLPPSEAHRPNLILPRPPASHRRGTEPPPPPTHHGAPSFGLPPPNPNPQRASPVHTGPPRLEPTPNRPPERRLRREPPPPTAGACGAAASDLLPANQGHPEVRLSPLYLFPILTLAAGEQTRRKSGRRWSSVLPKPARDLGLKFKKIQGVV